MLAISPERKQLILVNVALISAQIGFGGFSVVGKIALEHMKPIIFAFLREIIAGPLLLIIAAIVERVRPERADWWRFVVLGIVLYANQFCYIMGLKLTNSATVTAIMQQLIPVVTAAMAILLRIETLSIHRAFGVLKIFGIAFAVGGAAVMVGFKDFTLDRSVGMAILLCNSFTMSTYYIWQKPLLKKYPPITVTGWAYIVASMAMGLTSLYYVKEENVYKIPQVVYGPLAYAVFVQTIFGYCCVSWANKHAPASLVAVYNSVQPVVAAILSYFVLHEKITWNEGVGGALVIVGLGLVTWGRAKESADQAAKIEESPILPEKIGENDNGDKQWLLSAKSQDLITSGVNADPSDSLDGQQFTPKI